MKNRIMVFLTAVSFLMLISGCATPKIAGGPINQATLADGVYKGEAQHGPVNVIAEVTIQNQRIIKIDLLKHRNWKGKPAEQIIVRIIEEQSTNVDAVSGATMSSVAIMNAVEDAIQKAQEK
jgi:uncharacterized protein with FMN-binding domain